MSGSVQQANDQATVFRATLGMNLIKMAGGGLLVLGVFILAGAAIANYNNPTSTVFKDSAQLLLSALLPLFGTWVGTVLAFYFSKENFESASAHTVDLLRATGVEKLRSIPVTKGMIPRAQMIVLSLPANGTLGATTLTAVDGLFGQLGSNGQRISRLVILDAAGNLVGVLHRSIWMELLNEGSRLAPPVTLAAGTLGALIAIPVTGITGAANYGDLIQRAVAFVSAAQTLADAKAAMEAVTNCQDVMVTQTGAPATPVIGWITNADIGKLSEA